MLGRHLHSDRFSRGARDALRALRFTAVLGTPDYLSCAQQARPFADATYDYEPDYSKKHDIVRKSGVDVLHDALYNKVWEMRACSAFNLHACILQLVCDCSLSCFQTGYWFPDC